MKVEINEQELKKIQKVSITPVKPDIIYAFSGILLDNEVDNENERIESDALSYLSKLVIGMPGRVRQRGTKEIGIARIYDAEVVTEQDRKTDSGEMFSFLRFKAYIPRAEANEEIIQAIESAAKKEASIGFCVQSVYCSICGNDIKEKGCEHQKGKRYKSELCHYVLSKPVEFYEWEMSV